MKKNTMMRLASALLVAVLLTTSAISGTFAKYVTSDSASDTARVAKFGVVASIEGTLFGSSYKATTDDTIQTWLANAVTVSASEATTNVVAPGTKGDTMTFAINGTPEVSTAVTFGEKTMTNGVEDAVADSDIILKAGNYGVMVEWTGTITNETVLNKYTLNSGVYTKVTAVPQTLPEKVYELRDAATVSANYLPLDWKIGSTETSGMTVKAAKASLAAAFAPGTFTPNQSNALSQTITWDWDFEETDRVDTNSIYYNNDFADTILGDMIAQLGNVVVETTAGSVYTALQYANIPVGAAGNTTKAWVAYIGTNAPTYAPISGEALPQDMYAVLTVNFNAALTVTQVD